MRRERFFSGTTTTPAETVEPVNRKELLLWQLKLSAALSGVVVAAYGTYVVVSSGFQLDRCRRKVSLHWNGLFYGSAVPPRIAALVNSRYGACLRPELLHSLAAYFIKFDHLKENGFRRRDAMLFLESIGVDLSNPFVDRFIAAGSGESREHRVVSGCSLQEFAELLEALVLEQRSRGDNTLEAKLTHKLKELNGETVDDVSLPGNTFRLSNPLLAKTTCSMSTELRKYVREDIRAAETSDLQHELQRNYKFRDKLQQLSKTRKLSDAERRRLNDINVEIELLQDELSKQKHVCNILSSM
ncbi:recombination inhibitory 2 [Babesia caballi]|uniref:Recombination inhibitory 2 n=1 Tax=Babesia caballi TaxID=5871 RepID=A0AAV4LY03_BABCB|nr:recombination inhibitory 2 [Babesia caballi]